jgi:hypothetical protein
VQTELAVVSDEMAERVHDLLRSGAAALVAGWERRAAVVQGRTGWYVVKAFRDRVECDCLAASSGETCSHMLAAMVAWAEHGEADQ